MRILTREHVIVSGQYAEIEVFPLIRRPRVRRNKYRPTTEAQELINQNQAEMKLARIIHSNFTGNDIALHLTYSDEFEPGENQIDIANTDVKNFLRRCRRFYKKNNLELKYIYAVERSDRWHFHLIVSACGKDIDTMRSKLEKIWQMGFANADRLQFSEYGVLDLAVYVQKEHRNYRRWQGSHNLIQPTERQQIINKKAAEDYLNNWNCQSLIEKRFPDYFLVLDESDCFRNTTNGFDYIHLFLCRKDAKLSFYATSLCELDDRMSGRLKERRIKTKDKAVYEEYQQPRLW